MHHPSEVNSLSPWKGEGQGELGESTAPFSLSSDGGGGEGRGEESRFYWISPLPNPPRSFLAGRGRPTPGVPMLNSMAVHPCPLPKEREPRIPRCDEPRRSELAKARRAILPALGGTVDAPRARGTASLRHPAPRRRFALKAPPPPP